MIEAGARLKVLDLSDNAFGPIGVEGLAKLLQSDVCSQLQVRTSSSSFNFKLTFFRIRKALLTTLAQGRAWEVAGYHFVLVFCTVQYGTD